MINSSRLFRLAATGQPTLNESISAAAGNVLIPIDAAGRMLELVLLLERHWAENGLTYPLALLTPVAYNALEFAKSQLEWMADGVARAFEASRDNPFAVRCTPCLSALRAYTSRFWGQAPSLSGCNPSCIVHANMQSQKQVH